MENKRIEDADFSQTGYSYTLSLIAGKYKPVILYCLMEYEPVRFNQMQRYLGKIADKTLSAALKELERDGLIHREMYPEIPPNMMMRPSGSEPISVMTKICRFSTKPSSSLPSTTAPSGVNIRFSLLYPGMGRRRCVATGGPRALIKPTTAKIALIK